jgi:hypothetical protein
VRAPRQTFRSWTWPCEAVCRAGDVPRIQSSHHIYSKAGERKVISIPVHGIEIQKRVWQNGLPAMPVLSCNFQRRHSGPPIIPGAQGSRVADVTSRWLSIGAGSMP